MTIRTKVVLKVDEMYYATATTLNVRAQPSAEAEVLLTISRGEQVKVLQLTNEKWVKVEATDVDDNTIIGYVARAYLADDMTY